MGKKKSKTKPAPNIDITSLLFRTEAHQNMLPEPRETRESGRGLPGPEQLLRPGSAAGREATHRGRSPHAGHDQTRGRRGCGGVPAEIVPGGCECAGARRFLSPFLRPRIRGAPPPRGRPVETAGAVRRSGISRRRKAKGSLPKAAATAPA